MTLPLLAMIAIFVIGYTAIVTEHSIHIDKTASALFTAVLCWTVYIVFSQDLVDVANLPAWFLDEHSGKNSLELARIWISEHRLLEFLGEISSILFFLMGAMTIVEFVDAYGGFSIITDRINASKTVTLLWIIGIIAFFLSAALDNLTTTIVMISLIRKLVRDREDRLFFAGIIVIAANAGGAWSPIGDVTTTMLWIGNRVSTLHLVETILVPSLVCILVPLLYLSYSLRGQTIKQVQDDADVAPSDIKRSHRNIIFGMGIGGLLFVPIFKTLTHLPPFMGMLLSLSVLWVTSEILHRVRGDSVTELHITQALKRIDTSSVLFFLGILLAVGALESVGLLAQLAMGLDQAIGNIDLIVFLIGLFSAVIDNVPLVAASMGMYDPAQYPIDDHLWEFLAFAAGTGGSCLIIGSAAGVAAMGMEKINFFWYLKKISPLALLGYVGGAGVYLLLS
ncbi:sodium:proton antiporter NhaD [Reinekea forsetii]|nr:sodium:proton antiporter NhaD [Reinekea forsetii]